MVTREEALQITADLMSDISSGWSDSDSASAIISLINEALAAREAKAGEVVVEGFMYPEEANGEWFDKGQGPWMRLFSAGMKFGDGFIPSLIPVTVTIRKRGGE